MPNFLSNLSIPLKAIISRRFYFEVMINWRGVGLAYTFVLAAALALFGAIPTMNSLGQMNDVELPNVVAKIPASYVDTQGTLHPKHPTGQPELLKNSKGQLILVYNPYDDHEANQLDAMIILNSKSIRLNSSQGLLTIPWSAVYGDTGGDLEPIPMSQLMAETFSAGFVSCWIAVTVWIFCSLAFIVLISSMLGKILALLIYKVQIPFAVAFRLAAVGSTLAGLLSLAQFFFLIPISYWVMSLIPVYYIVSFSRDVRKIIDRARKDADFALSDENPLNEWFKKQKQNNPQLWENTYGPAKTSEDASKINKSAEVSGQDAEDIADLNDTQDLPKSANSNQDSAKMHEHKKPQRENTYAYNDKYEEDGDEHPHHTGEVRVGHDGKDSSFTP